MLADAVTAMRSWPFWLIAIFFLTGCRLPPVHVIADGQVVADGHVTADGKMSAFLAPTAEAGPVVPMSLPHDPQSPNAPRIAVVDIDGLLLNSDMTGIYSLGENPVALFRERLDAIAADPLVAAVVLRINSPGGGVTATDIMWHDLQSFKMKTHLPVVVCLLDCGAGGAYYLATAGDQIIAHPTAITGGVGVILNTYNLQDLMAQFNIVAVPVKAGKNIDLGTPVAPLDEERRKLLQDMADEFHDRFKRVVLQCRPAVDAGDATNFDGRVFTAEQALGRRLVDSIGYLDDAITQCQEIIHCNCTTVVFYHRLNDRANSTYSITPNVPLQSSLLPVSIPGLDRTKLPSFLYLWQPEPTMEKLSGR
jgi:protease IV